MWDLHYKQLIQNMISIFSLSSASSGLFSSLLLRWWLVVWWCSNLVSPYTVLQWVSNLIGLRLWTLTATCWLQLESTMALLPEIISLFSNLCNFRFDPLCAIYNANPEINSISETKPHMLKMGESSSIFVKPIYWCWCFLGARSYCLLTVSVSATAITICLFYCKVI